MTAGRKYKLAFILPCDAPGGGTFVAYRHARYLHQHGHAVTILYSNAKTNAEIRYFPGMEGIPLAHIRECLKEQAAGTPSFEFDAVIATWWGTYYEMMRVKAARYLYFVQSDERRFYLKQSLERWLAGLTYIDRGIGMITEARWIQKMLREEFGVVASYAPNGVDTVLFNQYATPLAPRGEKLRLLIEGPGTLPYKRIDLAFRVAQSVRDSRRDIEIWFVTGDGLIKPEWKPDRTFKQVALQEMPAIYASCDILLKLSTVEGVFGPPLEMMACGGTCVVTNVSGYDEYIVHHQNALVVPMNDEQAAREALHQLLTNEEMRRQFRIAGQETAERFAWQALHPHFEQAVIASLATAKPLSRIRRHQLYWTYFSLFSSGVQQYRKMRRHLRPLKEALRVAATKRLKGGSRDSLR